jgi:F-type H+-transporting ATPase subunit delta
MTNPRLAGRYAKSLLGLAVEQNKLDAICADIRMLQSICNSNPDFVNMLKSPVIPSDKKEKILEAITAGKVDELTQAFLRLLIIKTREYSLPEIVKAFIEQYNELNGIHQIKITTAVPVSDALKNALAQKIKSDSKLDKIELEMAVKDELIGGFTLEVGGTLIDASIQRDLNDVKKQFKSNEYIHAIR